MYIRSNFVQPFSATYIYTYIYINVPIYKLYRTALPRALRSYKRKYVNCEIRKTLPLCTVETCQFGDAFVDVGADWPP